jgi:AraC-like DNA-binding protein
MSVLYGPHSDGYPEPHSFHTISGAGREHLPYTSDYAAILFAANGSYDVQIEKSSLTLPSGGVLLLDSSVPYSLQENSPDSVMHIFTFRLAEQSAHSFCPMKQYAANGLFLDFQNKKLPFVLLLDEHTMIRMTYLTMEHLREIDSFQFKTAFCVLISQVLVEAAKSVSNAGQYDKTRYSPYVLSAIEYVRKNYSKNIHIKDVADAVGLHVGYMQRVFRNETGIPLKECTNRYRIEKAIHMLTHTDMPIQEIAISVGISTHQHFSNFFKKYTGLTPTQYRNDYSIAHHDGNYVTDTEDES